jgi:heme oxygenase
MDNYTEYKKENNVFYKPLEEILADKWFNETLPESWKSDTPIRQCAKYCSKKGKAFDKLQRLSR